MRVRFAERALADLDEIDDYIAVENPAAAARQIAGILAAVARLAAVPRGGRAGRLAGTRELVVTGTSYVVIYQISDVAIEILRVWHGRRKWPPS